MIAHGHCGTWVVTQHRCCSSSHLKNNCHKTTQNVYTNIYIIHTGEIQTYIDGSSSDCAKSCFTFQHSVLFINLSQVQIHNYKQQCIISSQLYNVYFWIKIRNLAIAKYNNSMTESNWK